LGSVILVYSCGSYGHIYLFCIFCIMKVKIVKTPKNKMWWSDYVGQTFNVVGFVLKDKKDGSEQIIYTDNCKIIQNETTNSNPVG